MLAPTPAAGGRRERLFARAVTNGRAFSASRAVRGKSFFVLSRRPQLNSRTPIYRVLETLLLRLFNNLRRFLIPVPHIRISPRFSSRSFSVSRQVAPVDSLRGIRTRRHISLRSPIPLRLASYHLFNPPIISNGANQPLRRFVATLGRTWSYGTVNPMAACEIRAVKPRHFALTSLINKALRRSSRLCVLNELPCQAPNCNVSRFSTKIRTDQSASLNEPHTHSVNSGCTRSSDVLILD